MDILWGILGVLFFIILLVISFAIHPIWGWIVTVGLILGGIKRLSE